MKKSILFMVINMNVGGTEKALLNMISEMPREKFDVTILMLEKYGGFLNSIPDWVQVEYVNGYRDIKRFLNDPPKIVFKDLLKQWKIVKACMYILLYLISKVQNNRSIFFNYILRNNPKTSTEYDVAVAYAGPMDFISFFIAVKIRAKKKIQWIHFDVNKIGFNVKFAEKIYSQFDKIFVVSKEGKEKLNKILPSLKHKTETFYNIVSYKNVIQMAEEGNGFEDNYEGLRILTVGRLSKEKGQDLTIPVLARLKQEGFNVRWYCVGEGNARSDYEQLIKNYKVEADFILLGSQANPYPFMKQCDIYVQPSRHEGYCITLAEARCFNCPIISTNFTGANEQILHKHNGLVVEGDKIQIYEAIKQIIIDQSLRNTIKSNIENEHVITNNDMQKITQMVI
ncbi:glycosyltransferase [Bacillus sp. 1NLA3E]|uniref:glycosyltransferase n=1 Tax=Bacillus sp. 1NLA3E TaxID=666686 RepID=UPI000247E8AA|nr:glycosyltransferase [Bacillus sp. 1NLA3E]AGK52662.1 group 1 glycosyl transferase [Bacillus sp. 1NLA3E]